MTRASLRYLLLVLLLLCVGVSGCGTPSNAAPAALWHGPENTVVPIGSPSVQVEPAHPTRLVIAAIGLDAPIESVGILANGDLDTAHASPWLDVGWYNQGPRPGEQGSAVIDGHVDRPGNSPAVFGRLRNLHKGDEVQVVDSAGKTLHFRVTDVAYYTPQNAPLQNIFGNTGGKYLNLITCAGDWIPSQNQTTLRLVVYTTLIG